MDGSRFDQFARDVASCSSRRTLIKALGGGVLAALGLARATGSADADNTCKPAAPKPQSKCTKDRQCCAGLVCQSGNCRPGCRINGTFYVSSATNPSNLCETCQPSVSTTRFTAKAITCMPSDQCHAAGTCDPGTGLCTDSAKPAGTSCGECMICDGQGSCGTMCAGSQTCCPAADGGCCECFVSTDGGNSDVLCCDEAKLCGTAPNDTCCHSDEDCVDGGCCHQTFHCEDRCCDRPCCGGACCAQGTECVNGTCVPEDRSCDPSATDDPTCFDGEICSTGDSVCCTPDRVYEVTVDTGGGPTVLTFCCPYGQQSEPGTNRCCSAPDFCGIPRGTRFRF